MFFFCNNQVKMYIGLFDIWKRILQSLGLIPPVNSRYILKDERQLYRNRVKPPEFDSANQVRVLLFREVNGQDRKLLFDSKAVRKRDPLASPSLGKPPTGANLRRRQESSIEKSFKLNENQSREYVYEWHKSNPDQSLLREMIFGAVSISYHGTTMKIHTIRSPSQIMLSVVFPAPLLPPSSRNGENETEESGTWNSSVEINIDKSAEKNDHLAHSVPVNVPSRLSGHYIESRDSDSDSLQSHDGHSSLPTTHLSPERPIGCLPRSSSYNSLQRRILRNKATSIELGLSKSHEMAPTEPVYQGTPGNQRQKQERIKLGLSIVINLKEDENNPENKHFTDFFFTHISLIEGHLMELKDTVIRGYINRRTFVHLMFEGSKQFQRCLHDLFTVPRLQNPEWLTIISSPNHRHLSYTFLERFSKLLRQFDKKETNFFVSTLLTAVLTHHLSWVPSVIPTDSKIQSTQSSHKHVPYWVDLLAKSRPYNPLWVQLSDLYGALGVPLRLTKTVVKGQKREVVQNFLRVLSYFIRCSDICQKEFDRAEEFCSENECFSARSPTLPLSCNAMKTDTKVTISTASSCSTTTEKLSPPTVASEVCLPQNLLLPQTNAASLDADCASHSSKDTCDLTITPTEDRTPEENSSISTQSVLVPNGPHESVKPSALDSLGYMSLEEKMEAINPSKRQALREQPANCCLEIGNTNSSACAMKEGKENDPSARVACAKDDQNCVCRPSKSKAGSSSKDYLSADDQQCSILCTKDTTLSCSKVKECESIEEGYHSMEEPHSPSRDNHLSEMLKRLENWCPEGCDGMPLPGLQQLGEDMEPSPYKSFGWSLMADVSDHYLSDFCLQGLCGPVREDEIQRDLLRKTQIHTLGEPASEALCIVADTDNWTVQLLSSHFMGCEIPGNLGTTVAMSSLVSGICDSIMNMVELGIPPESCIIYLEDRLQELYTRSQTLADYVRSCRFPIPQSRIASALNVDVSDLPLLISIATTHSPNLSLYNR